MFKTIRTDEDIREFLDRTNHLHDGYILALDFRNEGITKEGENRHRIDPSQTKLSLRILVTSILDTVVEIEFENLSQWQIKNGAWDDITDTSVTFDEENRIVWSDDSYANNETESGSFVVCGSMKWRIAE